jgi:hypothetical protein
MKIAINTCFGGFGLSKKAVKRMAELQGKECYFFYIDRKDGKRYYNSLDKYQVDWFIAFSIPNPNDYNPDILGQFILTDNPKDRTDSILIQVIEELKEEANGQHSDLKIVEIPDNVEWYIDDYDGIESIHEKHKSWD